MGKRVRGEKRERESTRGEEARGARKVGRGRLEERRALSCSLPVASQAVAARLRLQLQNFSLSVHHCPVLDESSAVSRLGRLDCCTCAYCLLLLCSDAVPRPPCPFGRAWPARLAGLRPPARSARSARSAPYRCGPSPSTIDLSMPLALSDLEVHFCCRAGLSICTFGGSGLAGLVA